MTSKTEPDRGCAFVAADSILRQLRAITAEIPGVRENKDIEGVHRMRVASRRLRTRLALFADHLPDRKATSFRKQARRLTRALGAARDTDVQIDFLQTLIANSQDRKLKPGLSRLLLRIRQRRDKRQDRVVKAIGRVEAGAFEELERLLRQQRVANRMRSAADCASEVMVEIARQAITARLEEMLGYEIYLEEPQRKKELHQMRIAAKRLRYAIEVFTTVFKGQFKKELKLVRDVQEILGDIHDCDVWAELMRQFLDKEKKRAMNYYGRYRGIGRLKLGLNHLAEDRRKFRDKRYNDLVALWKKARDEQRWEGMVNALAELKPGPSAEETPEEKSGEPAP